MIKNLDTSELQRLKGIGIGMTDDEQPFLIIAYRKKTSETALTCVYWSVITALLSSVGLLFWWAMQ